MQEGKIMHFHSMEETQIFLNKSLEELKKKSDEYSQLIGEKLRENTSENPAELAEIKEKLEGPTDPKKKKTVRKKDQKANWHSFGTILVYDGIGVKGELELYFKALEATKLKMEKVQKAKEAMDDLLSKGLKKDIGCAILLNNDLTIEMVFRKTVTAKAKFTFKSIFNIETEPMYEIKI